MLYTQLGVANPPAGVFLGGRRKLTECNHNHTVNTGLSFTIFMANNIIFSLGMFYRKFLI